MKNVAPTISVADDAILNALRRFHVMTSGQVCRLLFSRGSLTYVRARLRRLAEGGFCARLFLPRPTQHGSAPGAFRLTRKAFRYFESQGRDVPGRFRPSEASAYSYLFLTHTLAVNDVLIGVERFARQNGSCLLAEMRHDHDLKRSPVYVTDGDDRIGVVPDGWLDFRLGGLQSCFALELDRGTEERKQLQRKVRAYRRYVDGPYQDAFGTESLTVLFVTTAGERRLKDLLDWTQRVLEEQSTEDHSDLFRFAAFDASALEPSELFISPLWLRPFDRRPVQLLELSN